MILIFSQPGWRRKQKNNRKGMMMISLEDILNIETTLTSGNNEPKKVDFIVDFHVKTGEKNVTEVAFYNQNFVSLEL